MAQVDLHRKDPEISVSGNYVLSYDASPTFGRQDDWRWCKHCQGIFHGPSEGTSRCPAPGHPNHQRGASEGTGYSLALHQRRLMFRTFEFGVNWPVIVGYLGGPVVMVAAIILHRRSRPVRGWLCAALGLTIATIAITQLVSVPLNEAITAAGDPTVAEASPVRADFREDWLRTWNLARSATALSAFVCMSWALFSHGRTTARAPGTAT